MDEIQGSGALICVPTYDERENIELLISAVREAAPLAHILIADDNSPDGTGEIADRLANSDANLHVLHRPKKEGLGKAYLAAFGWGLARGYRYIVELDADFSHNPKYLPKMLSLLQVADVVVGSRRVDGGGVENWGAHRRILSWGGSLYARTVLGVPIKDLTGGLNAFRSEVLTAIDYETIRSTGYAFQIEIKYRCVQRGFRIEEMPIVFPDRVRGTSKMSAKIMGEAMSQVWRMRFRK